MNADELREALHDPDTERRREAIMQLAEVDAELRNELLYEALGDVDWRVRKESVNVAAEIARHADVMPLVVDGLADGENVGRRNAVLEVIGRIGSQATASLLEVLPKVDEPVRKFVVDALGDTGDPAVVDALIAAAEDDDANVAAAAIDSLARVGGAEAERALRRRLSASDPFQRLAALDGLARLDAEVPWEELEPLLSDRIVRRVALQVLGRTDRPEAVAPLVEALGDRPSHVVADAAQALARLWAGSDELANRVTTEVANLPDDSRTGLRALVHHQERPVQAAAAELLLLARDEEALPRIVRLAVDDALSPAALEALRGWGTAAVSPLIAVHRGSDGVVRAAALELASDLAVKPLMEGRSVDDELVSELRAMLRAALTEAEPVVVLAAARSMTWWAEAADAGRLVELASRSTEEVGRAAAEALEALARTHLEAVRTALEGVELSGSGGAALAPVLARVGGTRLFERLQTALSENEPATRRAAVDALAHAGGERAAELIGYALTDEHVDVQTSAARALGRLRDEDGGPLGNDALLQSLESDAPAVQAAAARALGDAGDARALGPLRDLVHSAHPGVSVAALEALRALSDPTLGDQLVEALGHRDPEVVKQALNAIPETHGPRVASRLALGLAHSSWDVRALAARQLGRLGGSEPRAALEKALADEDDDLVRSAIEQAIRDTEEGG
jgi:HEAT repeat protein